MFKKILLAILVLVILIASGGYLYYRLKFYKPPLITKEDRTVLNLMPLPAKLKFNEGILPFGPDIEITYSAVKNPLMEQAVERFMRAISSRLTGNKNGTAPIKLNITCIAELQPDGDPLAKNESYKLAVGKHGILLYAESPYGILQGLETLAQMVEYDAPIPHLRLVEINDQPRFVWRGLMLDVSRHWIPKEVVLRLLDGMAAAKLNVFHWHLSDDQGFRVESNVFPKLHEIGSNGKYYTQAEIGEVIAYATSRGIRVVPEFDLPGHSVSWQIAYPELSSVDYPLQFTLKKGQAFTPPLDPTKEVVYEFLDKFIAEMALLFPDPYFHIGGDEVNPQIWNTTASIQEFMKANNIADGHGLQAYFIDRVHAIIKKHGKKMVGWDEILEPTLAQDVIVQCWRGQKVLFEAVQQGGTAILSSGYYLDHKLSAGKHYSIDPTVLPGAVDIVPDSSHWKMYDLTMDISGSKMNSQMVLFDRDTTNVFGYFAILDNRMPFKGGSIDNGELAFKLNMDLGELSYTARLLEDSLNGEISIGPISFGSYGHVIGGSNMPGTIMPKIEIVKPLTSVETARVLGGEACMWSELVNEHNVESRVWPRAAAIAEKLWSPQQLTSDTDDMYRRLSSFSAYLETLGSRHNAWYADMLPTLIDSAGFPALNTLAQVLEEVKFVKRLIDMLGSEGIYLPDFPLDRMADIVYPESSAARLFNRTVDDLTADPNNSTNKASVIASLTAWEKNHSLLEPYFAGSEKLTEVRQISLALSDVSSAARRKINGQPESLSIQAIEDRLTLMETGAHGVICAVAPGLRKLLMPELQVASSVN